ncbi:fimbrial protein [uncultured Alistipes sp.]|uniref:fimbrial protein n=1 Tax=uncultured Alistipes sp. TaxID=538949 RepID=UPI0025D3B789|nr:fimbrial protein [uncultured Alistipes sp.]
MRTQQIARRLLFLSAILLTALTSCSEEYASGTPSTIRNGEATVTFALNVPGNSTPASRAGLSAEDETNVQTIDVLLFRKDGSDRLYWGKVPGVSLDNTPGSKKSFQAVIPVGDYSNFDITVIANGRAIIAGAGLAQGDEKSAALDKLILDMSGESDARWSSNTIPMWGEALNVDVNENTNLSGENAVKMTRMIARIDVKLSHKAATGSDDDQIAWNNDNFELTSVRLYNYSQQGTLAPDLLIGWDASGDAPYALAPHEPVGGFDRALYDTYQPLVYETGDQHSSAMNLPDSLIRAIYTLEAPAGSGAALATNTCLVIGGSYRNGVETYYRVDFARKNGATYDYLPLKRNFRYVITVSKISGPGFETPDIAFKSRPVNIEADVLDWNEFEYSEIEFDNTNFLSVNKGVFNLFRESQTTALEDRSNVLMVNTNVREGWQIVSIDYENEALGSGWLATDVTEGPSGKSDVLLRMEQENISGESRKAFVTIKAGRLNYVVTVIQSHESDFGIRVLDMKGNPITELYFTSGRNAANPIEEQQIQVVYGPGTANMSVDYNYQNNKAIDWSGGDEPASIPGAPGNSGRVNYTIKPMPFTDTEVGDDPFLSKVARISFEIEHPVTKDWDGKLLYVYQRQPNLTVGQSVVNAAFTGATYNIEFNTNTEWEVSFGGTKPEIATAVTATSGGAGNGQNFKFSVPLDLDADATSFTVIFSSPTGEFDPKTVTVNVAKPTLSISPGSIFIDAATYGYAATTSSFTITTNLSLDQLNISSTGIVTLPTLNKDTNVVTFNIGAATTAQQTGTVVVKAGSLSQTFNVTREAVTLTISKTAETFTYATGGQAGRTTTFTISTNVPIDKVGIVRAGTAITAHSRSGNTITVTIAASGSSQTTGTITVSLGSIISRTYTATREKKPGTPIGGVNTDPTVSSAARWAVADADCKKKGGRLPTWQEYRAIYVTGNAFKNDFPGSSQTSYAWVNVENTAYYLFKTQLDVERYMEAAAYSFKYRCVYP